MSMMMTEFKKFIQEESGQTTTEYMLILAVIVTIFMQFKSKLMKLIKKLFDSVDSGVDQAVSEEGGGG